MDTVIRESPALYFEGKAKDQDQVTEEFSASFCHIRVDLPVLSVPVVEELSDDELLSAAEAAGTFNFLDGESEDVYQP